MTAVIWLIAVVILVVAPVKFAALYVRAGRTGIGSCLIAVLIASALQKGLEALIHPQLLQYLAALVLTPLVFMFVLDTTYKKGLIVTAVQLLLAVALFFVLMAVLPSGTLKVSH